LVLSSDFGANQLNIFKGSLAYLHQANMETVYEEVCAVLSQSVYWAVMKDTRSNMRLPALE